MVMVPDHIRLPLILNEIRLEQLMDFLPYPFLISEWKDGNQQNIFVNKKFETEIGYTLKEIPTITDWFKLAYPDSAYQKEVIAKWELKSAQAKRLGRDSVIMKARVHTKQKGEQWYQVKASISGKVNLVAFINIHEEVTRELELEQQNENKNQTLSILTHDLRGPLNNLMSILQLSGQGLITPEEYAHSINSLSSNVFKLIEFFDTTLQWTRSNFAQVHTAFQPTDLQTILEDILHVYRSQYEEKRIQVSVDVRNINNLKTDPEIVSIVSRNILSNAIKFTKENDTIRVSAQPRGNRTVIAFEDTGTGMSQERIDMIVKKDYASERGTAGEKGLGMGLRLCNQLLFKIGGKLEIESEFGKGTIVKMVL